MLCVFQYISEDRDMNSNFAETNIIYSKSTRIPNGSLTSKNNQFEYCNSFFILKWTRNSVGRSIFCFYFPWRITTKEVEWTRRWYHFSVFSIEQLWKLITQTICSGLIAFFSERREARWIKTTDQLKWWMFQFNRQQLKQ